MAAIKTATAADQRLEERLALRSIVAVVLITIVVMVPTPAMPPILVAIVVTVPIMAPIIAPITTPIILPVVIAPAMIAAPTTVVVITIVVATMTTIRVAIVIRPAATVTPIVSIAVILITVVAIIVAVIPGGRRRCGFLRPGEVVIALLPHARGDGGLENHRLGIDIRRIRRNLIAGNRQVIFKGLGLGRAHHRNIGVGDPIALIIHGKGDACGIGRDVGPAGALRRALTRTGSATGLTARPGAAACMPPGTLTLICRVRVAGVVVMVVMAAMVAIVTPVMIASLVAVIVTILIAVMAPAIIAILIAVARAAKKGFCTTWVPVATKREQAVVLQPGKLVALEPTKPAVMAARVTRKTKALAET